MTFGKPVVPGALAAALFSSLIARELPGAGSEIVGQMLKFLKPIYVGETVTATVEVVSIREDETLVRMGTRAATARGLCIDGEAVIRVRPLGSNA